jgi:hypothetical protein
MGKFSGSHSYRAERVPLLTTRQLGQNSENGQPSDLEHGDAIQAANVGFGRVLSLAKPEALNLVIATCALLIASTSSILIPKFGGQIIDIVSQDIQTPEQKHEAWSAITKTILGIFVIVLVGLHSSSSMVILFGK